MAEDTVKNLTTLLREKGESPPARLAVLVRADEALHRIDQLAVALERAASDIERQLAAIKARL